MGGARRRRMVVAQTVEERLDLNPVTPPEDRAEGSGTSSSTRSPGAPAPAPASTACPPGRCPGPADQADWAPQSAEPGTTRWASYTLSMPRMRLRRVSRVQASPSLELEAHLGHPVTARWVGADDVQYVVLAQRGGHVLQAGPVERLDLDERHEVADRLGGPRSTSITRSCWPSEQRRGV